MISKEAKPDKYYAMACEYDEDFKQAKAITDNQVNLCLSCENRYPECGAENVIFGDGVGHDNICCCNKYKALLMRYQIKAIL